MSSSMFETLLELPLFRGVTLERMSSIVGSCKFNFVKYAEGEIIFAKGEPCHDLIFMLSGSARAALTQDGNPYGVYQTFKPYTPLAPEYMFGMQTNYPLEIRAIEPVSVLRVSKSDYIKILNSDQVFMFNYLNMISKLAQKNFDGIVSVTSGNPVHSLAYWVYVLTFNASHDIVFGCPPEMLAPLMGVDAVRAIEVLTDLKNKELVDFDSNEVRILDRKRLLEVLKN